MQNGCDIAGAVDCSLNIEGENDKLTIAIIIGIRTIILFLLIVFYSI